VLSRPSLTEKHDFDCWKSNETITKVLALYPLGDEFPTQWDRAWNIAGQVVFTCMYVLISNYCLHLTSSCLGIGFSQTNWQQSRMFPTSSHLRTCRATSVIHRHNLTLFYIDGMHRIRSYFSNNPGTELRILLISIF
jgi:hypothetical protein